VTSTILACFFTSSHESSENGAAWPGRWHEAQLAKMIGATSDAKARAAAGGTHSGAPGRVCTSDDPDRREQDAEYRKNPFISQSSQQSSRSPSSRRGPLRSGENGVERVPQVVRGAARRL
jgi:hypothetical protein